MTTSGLWFRERLDPDSAAVRILAYQVTGRLDTAALRTAWRRLVNRHSILRAVYAQVRGELRPHISTDFDPSSFADSGAVAGVPVARWCADLPTPRLSGGPVARLDVARFAEDTWALRFAVHAAIADEVSAALLLDDLATEYTAAAAPAGSVALAASADSDAGVTASSAGSGGVARPAPARLAVPTGERGSLGWWVERLSPPPPAIDIPTDRARPTGPSAAGAAVSFAWNKAPVVALSEVAAPEALLLAAYQALLWRYCGGDQVAVAVAVSLRPVGAAVVGPFANLVPQVADLSGGPTFRELAAAVETKLAESEPHQAVPFADVVAAVNPERDPRRTPLCDAVFAYGASPARGPVLPGAVLFRVPVDPFMDADLALRVNRVDECLTGTLEYRTSLFDADSARAVLDQLHTLLTAAAADPDRPVAELALDTDERVRASVRAADAATTDPAPTARVNDLVRGWAERTPDAVAISWNGQDVTYRELIETAATVTAALTGTDGAPVAVRMPTGPRLVATLQGVLDAGAHLVCLGQADVGERGRAVLADVTPTHLLIDGPQADDLAEWYADELAGELIDLADLADAAPAASASGGSGLAGSAPAGLAGGGSAGGASGGLTEPAYVTHTSGSTGAPKGIPQNHGTFAQFAGWFAAEFGIGPGSRVAQWAAPGYDAGLVEVFAALAAGGTLCPVPDKLRANPDKLVGWLADERITLLQTVPSFARQLLRALVDSGGAERLGGLNHLLLAGEALPGDLVAGLRALLPDARLVNLYGPTESILATWHEIVGPVTGVTPVGRSIPGRHVLVLDSGGRPCPRGVTGEIVIRSPYLTAGYLGAAAGERAAFAPVPGLVAYGVDGAGCYRTGDLGRLRFDGALEFVGRKDFQVKFNGVRLELADIEAALSAHDSVAECAVVALRGADGLVSRLVGFVVPRRDADGRAVGGASVWRTALRARFGRGMPPVAFETVLGLPRTVGGKVDRRRLPVPGQASPATPAAAYPAVAELWAELLPVDEIDPTTGFFAAGGHSGLALRMLAEVRARIGVDVPLRDFLADPTPAGIAAAVESQSVSLETQPTTG